MHGRGVKDHLSLSISFLTCCQHLEVPTNSDNTLGREWWESMRIWFADPERGYVLNKNTYNESDRAMYEKTMSIFSVKPRYPPCCMPPRNFP